ncbi:hypothetical protein R1flu_004599 [Riccia fluitans]|uniref:Uncharacterized protein n=1 Tax=Riccia fluitans TaxID=41844 RepID=A0ABD1YR52_9MARC
MCGFSDRNETQEIINPHRRSTVFMWDDPVNSNGQSVQELKSCYSTPKKSMTQTLIFQIDRFQNSVMISLFPG